MQNQKSQQPEPFLDDSILFSTISKDPNATQLKHDIQKLFEIETNQSSSISETNYRNMQNQSQTQPNMQQNVDTLQLYCNNSLNQFGFPKLGNIQNPSKNDQFQTLTAVQALLSQRQKDIQFRSQMVETKAKIESDLQIQSEKYKRMSDQYEKQSKLAASMENKVLQLKQQMKSQQSTHEQIVSDLNKNIKNLNQKLIQSHHETRKMEIEKEKAKESFRQKIGQDKIKYQNSSDQVQFMHNWRRQNLNREQIGQIEYGASICENLDSINRKLLEENQQLRNGIAIIQAELNDMVQQVQNNFLETRTLETHEKIENLKNIYFPNLDLVKIDESLYQMPFEKVGVQIITMYNQNFQIVKEIFNKILSFAQVKNIIQNQQQINNIHNQSNVNANSKIIESFQNQTNKDNKKSQNQKKQKQLQSQQNQAQNQQLPLNHINFKKQSEMKKQNLQNNNNIDSENKENQEDTGSVRINQQNNETNNLQDILEKVNSMDAENHSKKDELNDFDFITYQKTNKINRRQKENHNFEAMQNKNSQFNIFVDKVPKNENQPQYTNETKQKQGQENENLIQTQNLKLNQAQTQNFPILNSPNQQKRAHHQINRLNPSSSKKNGLLQMSHSRNKTDFFAQQSQFSNNKKEILDTRSELSLSFVSQVSIKDVSDLHYIEDFHNNQYTQNNQQNNQSNILDNINTNSNELNVNYNMEKTQKKQPLVNELKKWHRAFNHTNTETSNFNEQNQNNNSNQNNNYY